MDVDDARVRVLDALVRLDLYHGDPAAIPPLEAITGGVSSQLWRVRLPDGPVVTKWALARLAVVDVWEAPTARSTSEVAYLRLAAGVVPGRVPQVLGSDPDAHLFVMEDLGAHPVWKTELRAGRVDPAVAGAVGATIGRIHAATAGDAEVQQRFATDALFDALRIEPYLDTTAARRAEVATPVAALAAGLRAHAGDRPGVLVHGDVSPKNILLADQGPILLDAECAWYGDAAFDPAFCLTHLLLKALDRPDAVDPLERSARALLEGYLAQVTWEPADTLVTRIGALLPALLLARVDGRSPVEYLDEAHQATVRSFATARLLEGASLSELVARWYAERRVA